MTRHFVHNWLFTLAVALVAGALACGGSSENPAGPTAGPTTSGPSDPGGPGSPGVPSPSGKGRLTLAMTDGPFSDASAVLVAFDNVSIHRSESNGWETLPLVSSPRVCDLKRLQGSTTDILGVAEMPAGHYTQIRLSVTLATIYFDTEASGGVDPCTALAPDSTPDQVFPVEIPSGVIKLNRQFTLEAGSNMMIVLDFDGDKSIHKTGGGNGNGNSKAKYIMKPVIGIVSVGAVE